MVVQHVGTLARFLKGIVEEGKEWAIIGMIVGGFAGYLFQPVDEAGAIGNVFLLLFWGGVIGWCLTKLEDKGGAARAAREEETKKPD